MKKFESAETLMPQGFHKISLNDDDKQQVME